ncbi:hypothetical protein [Thermoactinomyces sp. DSM 45892]|uniref:hypothetical protein n=2 Tax=Thermoactinomyces sp. DSM 45892 TaxID=1882753 RepID=UPI0008946926|nr:hypothetical protein [Thermoactinomyces sp. DSM 45892]SDY35681.1 hypothetical protein SAMN05444416_10423 [Thermoactinomyces sp. DSM 45892]
MRFVTKVFLVFLHVLCLLVTSVSFFYLIEVVTGDFSSMPYSFVILALSLYIGGWLMQRVSVSEWILTDWIGLFVSFVEIGYIYFYITINFIISKIKGYRGTYREYVDKYYRNYVDKYFTSKKK